MSEDLLFLYNTFFYLNQTKVDYKKGMLILTKLVYMRV